MPTIELPNNIYEKSFKEFYSAFCTGINKGQDPICQSNNKEHDAEANFFLENAVFNLMLFPGVKKEDFIKSAKSNIDQALDSLFGVPPHKPYKLGKMILSDLWQAYYHPAGILNNFPQAVFLKEEDKRKIQFQLICNCLFLFHGLKDGLNDFNLLHLTTWDSFVNLFTFFQKELLKEKNGFECEGIIKNKITRLLSLERWNYAIESIKKSAPDILIFSLGSANNELQFNPSYPPKLAEQGKKVLHLNCDYFSEKKLRINYEKGGELQTTFADIFFMPQFDSPEQWAAPLQTLVDKGQEIIINSYINCNGLHPGILRFAQHNLDKIGTQLKLVFGHENNQACFLPTKAFFEQKMERSLLSGCGFYKFTDKEELIEMDNIQALNDALQKRNLTHIGYFVRLTDINFKERPIPVKISESRLQNQTSNEPTVVIVGPKSAQPLIKKQNPSRYALSMMILGGFISIIGITAVVLALTLLAVTSPTGLICLGLGAVALLGGLGLFKTGLDKKIKPQPSLVDSDLPQALGI